MTDDMPALESWLESEALSAHNRAAKLPPYQRNGIEAAHEERTLNRVLKHIRDGRANQRPHMQHPNFAEGY